MNSNASVVASTSSSGTFPFFPSSSQTYSDAQPSVSTSMYNSMQYSSPLLCGMQSQYFNSNQLQPSSGPGAYQFAPRQTLQQQHSMPSSSSSSFTPFLDDPPPSSCSSLFLPSPCSLVSPLPLPISASASTIPPNLAPHGSAHQTTAMDSCQQISHVLQCYQQGGEDIEFVKKAIESLVKKLKDKRQELDSLITAITAAGKQPTGCVTIQVREIALNYDLWMVACKWQAGKEFLMLSTHEYGDGLILLKLLQKNSQCTTPTDDSDFICINPYHYERVVSNGLNPLDVNSSEQMHNLTVGQKPIKEDYGLEYDMNGQHMQQQSSQQQSYQDWINSGCIPNQQLNNEMYQSNNDLSQVHIPASSHVPDHWCSIIYYELDTQIGETFKVRWEMPEVTVDGGMDPQGEKSGRFCLGALSNIHRGEASEKARIHIGHGLHLQHLPDGRVILQSLSKIFVQSGYLDFCNGCPYGSKVHRFTQESPPTTLFDLRWAYKEMLSRTRSTSEALRAQAAAVAGYSQGAQLANLPSMMADSGVDGMRSSFCTIKVSFVKGWGERYPRKAIKETPCWIEIQLHRPLQLLDQLLKSSGSL
ncbi:hypothetical protein WR25_15204 [Diploscapter pachys]|uniref:Mothers against decapentaplegic homolog n=1 Tax=Diploscapter pachys TaxID=2018661 RepID=A0A2A2K7W7_9BILA|nr:hypothetical protein WR25_15204 [Diploscapter pachys]